MELRRGKAKAASLALETGACVAPEMERPRRGAAKSDHRRALMFIPPDLAWNLTDRGNIEMATAARDQQSTNSQVPTHNLSAPIDLEWLSDRIPYRRYQECVHCGR
jgi:hypothetical protein